MPLTHRLGTLAYALLLLLASATALGLLVYTGLLTQFRPEEPTPPQLYSNYVFASLSAIGFLALLTGLASIFSRKFMFTALAGFGAASILLVCLGMILEEIWTGKESSFLAITLPQKTYGLSLVSWIYVPLTINIAALLLALGKSTKVVSFLR